DYLDFYRDYIAAGISVDMAAYDLRRNVSRTDDERGPYLVSRLDDVVDAINRLVEALGDLSDEDVQDAVVLAHWRSQSFKFEQYTDLWDFCHLLRRSLARHAFAAKFAPV